MWNIQDGTHCSGKAGGKMNPFKQKLIELEACVPALDWVGERTLEEAWAECDCFAWLEWVACKLNLPKTEFVNLACRAARSAGHLIPEGKNRHSLAVEAAEKWLTEPTEKNRLAAAVASSGSVVAAVSPDTYAARADSWAADAAASRTAPDIAYSVAYTAKYAARALCETEATFCAKFREFYPVELVKRGLGL